MSASMIPIVASADDIDAAVKYGNNHPNARWYIGKRLDALDSVEQIPADWPETAAITAARLPKLGTGKRFANLKGQLAKRGVNNPGALAAYIGRKKFGAKKMAKLSAHGRTAAAVTAAAGDDDGSTDVVDRTQAGQPTPGWLRRVRAEIGEAGIDPDYVEATVPGGFSSNYDGTDAVSYAEQLIQAYAESISDEFPELLEGDPTDGDDDQADDDTATPDAPEATPPSGNPASATATADMGAGVPAMTASGAHTVNFYGGMSPEALTAAVRGVVKEELKGLTAALPLKTPEDDAQAPDAVDPDGDGDDDSIPGGPGDTDMDGGTGVPDSVPPAAGPDGGAPVDDLAGQKQKLRARLGGLAAAGPPPGLNPPGNAYGLRRRQPPATTPVGAPSTNPPPASTDWSKRRPVMAAGAMRARLAEAGGQGNS